MAKKYYWLKFQADFFSDIRILKLRNIAGGDTYLIIFLKLMLLSIKNEGIIVYEGVFKTIAEELSYVTRENQRDVQIVLDFCYSHNMIEENENIFLIPMAADNIGSETDSAARKRKQRAKEKLENVTLSHPCPKLSHREEKDLEEKEKLEELSDFLLNKQLLKDIKKDRLLELMFQENEVKI